MFDALKRIFGTNIILNLDFNSEEADPEEEINAILEKKLSQITKISQILENIPKKGFVILYFDKTEDLFVQFTHNKGHIVLDVPFFKTTGKDKYFKPFTKILKSYGIRRLNVGDHYLNLKNKKYTVSRLENGNVIDVYFRNNNRVAGEIALSLAKLVFGIKNPKVNRCSVGYFP